MPVPHHAKQYEANTAMPHHSRCSHELECQASRPIVNASCRRASVAPRGRYHRFEAQLQDLEQRCWCSCSGLLAGQERGLRPILGNVLAKLSAC